MTFKPMQVQARTHELDITDYPKGTKVGEDGVPRDRWGRPMVWHRGAFHPYSRPSSVIPSGGGNLEDWIHANGAFSILESIHLGITTVEDASAMVEAWDGSSSMLQIPGFKEAMMLTRRHDAASRGTWTHSAVESRLVGDGQMPPSNFMSNEEADDLWAYSKIVAEGITEDWEIVECETYLVNDTLKTMGSADYIMRFKGKDAKSDYSHLTTEVFNGTMLVVGDLKTGKTIKLDAHSGQLACYASGSKYSFESRRRTKMNINGDIAIIFHTPVATRKNKSLILDLREAQKGVRLYQRAREAMLKPARFKLQEIPMKEGE